MNRSSQIPLLGSIAMALIAMMFVHAQTSAADSRDGSVQVTIRANANCTNNLVRLQDIAEVSGSKKLVESLSAINLGPAPAMGKAQAWTRKSLQKQIDMMGYDSKAIEWKGAESCNLRRVEASNLTQAKYHALQSNIATSQAERNVESAVYSYLNTYDPKSSMWKVSAIVSPDIAPLLNQRRLIKGIAGGSEPWDGRQEFQIVVGTPDGDKEVTVEAIIKQPPLVVAANKPLRQGQIVHDDDLELVPLPLNSKIKAQDCNTEFSGLVGKELRKAVSTGQAITRFDVGSPRIVDKGDLIKVELVSGSILIEANAKCLEPGGMNDLVQVEVLPQKKKLVAQVVGEYRVRVVGSSQ